MLAATLEEMLFSLVESIFTPVGWMFSALAQLMLALWNLATDAVAFIFPERDITPRQMLNEPRFLSVSVAGLNDSVAGLDRLPTVPPLPPHIKTVTVAGCANLRNVQPRRGVCLAVRTQLFGAHGGRRLAAICPENGLGPCQWRVRRGTSGDVH